MKILIVAPLYPPYALGGGGAVISAIAKGLAKRGHRITVLSGCFSEKPFTAIPQSDYNEGFEIIWIPLLSCLKTQYPQLSASMPPNIPSLAFLEKMNYDSYDIIHLSAFGHLIIDCVNVFAKSSNKILTIHGFPKYVGKGGEAILPLKILYAMFFGTLGRHTINSAKRITAVSSFVANECTMNGIPKDKITVIPNGVELEKYRPTEFSELKEEFQLKDNDIVILTIARIAWHKGLEFAIKAVYKVIKLTKKSIKYVIIGPVDDQIYYSRIVELIDKLGIKKNVVFTGFLSRKKFQALTRANIFLAPSLHESFGLTVLEAMASGKPIIASNCEGFRSVLEHMKTGIFVEPANVEEIANALLLLLSDINLRERLSKNAVSAVQKYDWKERVAEYERLYEQISFLSSK